MLPHLLALTLAACCPPLPTSCSGGPAAGSRSPLVRSAGGGGPEPFLVSPVTIDGEFGPPYDHGSTDKNKALMYTGQLVGGKPDHRAYDFPMPVGTEVVAAASGVVLYADDGGAVNCGGNPAPRNVWIKLRHDVQSDGFAYVSRYYHLSELLVKAGERVEAGQRIGRSGNTGCSQAPHLHFSIARVSDPQDPDGHPTDPYGWAGAQPDPIAVRSGHESHWLWKEGRAPPLVRRKSLAQTDGPDLAPMRTTFLDALAPIDGEWLEIGVRRTAKGRHRLRGMTLRNHAGDRLSLPDVALGAGEMLRVWTRRANPGAGEISWGLDHQAWNDTGDCAMLLDASGTVVAALGTGEDTCRTRLGTRP